MQWPNDADGDVFRRFEKGNFDFNKEYEIDFNIDFEQWPPTDDAIATIKRLYPTYQLVEPDKKELDADDSEEDNYPGYIEIKITSEVTYEIVIETQRKISKLMEKYGGWCDTWGVLH